MISSTYAYIQKLINEKSKKISLVALSNRVEEEPQRKVKDAGGKKLKDLKREDDI